MGDDWCLLAAWNRATIFSQEEYAYGFVKNSKYALAESRDYSMDHTTPTKLRLHDKVIDHNRQNVHTRPRSTFKTQH